MRDARRSRDRQHHGTPFQHPRERDLRGSRTEPLRDAIEQLKSRFGFNPIAKIVEVEPWSRIPERRLALMTYDL